MHSAAFLHNRLGSDGSMSLKLKIAGIIIALEALVVLLVLWQTLSFSLDRTRELNEATDKITLDNIALLSTPALLTGDYSRLRPIMERLGAEPRIERIILADSERRVVASNSPDLVGSSAWSFLTTNPKSWSSREIRSRSGDLGILAIEYSDAVLIEANADARNFGLIIGLAGMVLIGAVGWGAGVILTRRVDRLAFAADRIAKGDITARVGLAGRDEVARVGQAFDVMVEAVTEKLRSSTESEQRFRGVFEQAATGIARISTEGQFLEVNRAFAKALGYDRAEMTAKSLSDITQAEYLEGTLHSIRLLLAGVIPSVSAEQRYVRKDGETVAAIMTLSLVAEDEGASKYLIAVIEDITELKNAEESLRKAEASYRQIYENASEGLYRSTSDGRLLSANPALVRLNRFDREEDLLDAVNGTLGQIYVDPNRREELVRLLERQGRVDEFVSEAYRAKTGERIWISENAHTVTDDDGGILYIEGSVQDITERRLAEEALRERNLQSKAAERLAQMGHWVIDEAQQMMIDCSDEFPRLLQVARQQILGAREKYHRFVYPDDLNYVVQTHQDVRQTPRKYEIEYRVVRKDGQIRYVREIGQPVLGTSGELIQFTGTLQDVTERRQTEMQLVQAQKMEAVGQLTGGIAHDFNNLLTIVLGNLNLLKEDLADNIVEDADERIDDAISAGRQGAELVQRLLAYGRKQTLRPTAIDVDALVESTCRLLRRTLEEYITMEVIPGEDLWPGDADPAQLEQAIINLSINARDAMPEGGTLRVETRNRTFSASEAAQFESLTPGPYVEIAVSDSGEGMSPELLEKVWQPFFTTKDVGQGSGMGLSMVHGFVKQSGGDVAIESTVGEGTTVRLFLPKSQNEMEAAEAVAPSNAKVELGDETILVVEDDPGLRRVATAILSSLGYEVLEADDGASALNILAQTPNVDLLFTDVVLPHGMNGVVLGKEARALYPKIKVLYTSGYSKGANTQSDGLGDRFRLVPKPYRKSILAEEIRQVLDGREV